MRLILIRGVPGSGKSTIAKRISSSINAQHLETDMFWDDPCKPDFLRLRDAHNWCISQAQSNLRQGRSVVVSNTFIRKWELSFYFTIAREFGIIPEVYECSGRYQNIHGVPDKTVHRLAGKFERDISSLYKILLGGK